MTLLTGRQAAERAGITYNAWKLAPRTKRGRPAPDRTETYGARRIQLWRPETVDAWRSTRRPTHVEVIAGDRRLHPRVVRRHLKRHESGDCSCPK